MLWISKTKWYSLPWRARLLCVVRLLILYVIYCFFNLYKSKAGSKFSWTPQMPSRISQSCFRIIFEKQSCRNSFQILQRLSRRHLQRNTDDAMHMFWLDIQLQNFYSVHCSCSSYTSSYQVSLLFLAEHFIPILRTPFKVPHWYPDAVAPPFIFFRIALANQYLCFHFILRAERVVALRKVYLEQESYHYNFLCSELQSSSLFITISEINIHRNSFIGLKAKDFLRKD